MLDWLAQNTLEKPRIDNDTKVVIQTDVSESKTFDVILGSDIVYERGLIKPLCEILKQNLRATSSAVAYIACTERSRTTLECFEVYLTIYIIEHFFFLIVVHERHEMNTTKILFQSTLSYYIHQFMVK